MKLLKNRLIYILIFLVILFLYQFVRIDLSSDDAYFISQAHKLNLLEFLRIRYMTWSSRIVSEGLLYIFIKIPIIFYRLFSALILTSIIYNIRRLIFHDKSSVAYTTLSACSIFAINAYVLASSFLQYTASFNYLLGTALLLYINRPFLRYLLYKEDELSDDSFSYSRLAMLVVLFFMNEQIGAISSFIVVSSGILLSIEGGYKRILARKLIYISVIMLSFLMVFASPGNSLRMQSNILYYKNDFNEIGLSGKIINGIPFLFNSMINQNRVILISLLAFSVLIYIIKHKYFYDIKKRFIALIGIIFLVFPIIVDLAKTQPHGTIFNVLISNFDFNGSYGPVLESSSLLGLSMNTVSLITTYFFWSALLILVTFFIYDILGKRGLIIFFGSVIGLVLMVLSPTVYASGNRIIIVPSILILLLSLRLLSELFKNHGAEERLLCTIVSALLALMFCTNYVPLLLFWTRHGHTSIY